MNIDFIEKYYTSKIKEFGPTSKGADWKDGESQVLRFQQLLRGFSVTKENTILDYGCGYGAFLEYLNHHFKFLSYYGYDISLAMLEEAKKIFFNQEKIEWSNNLPMNQSFDYTFLSGLFNVRNEQSDTVWKDYIIDTLNNVNKISENGFSFNILTSYSDIEHQKNYLYYADPLFFFDYCKRNFSKYVTLYHDYPLYEFTISVTRQING